MYAQSDTQLWYRALVTIADAMDHWHQTDVKKVERLKRLVEAQELVEIFVNQLNDRTEASTIVRKIMLKVSLDLTKVVAGERIDLRSHASSIRFIASSLLTVSS